MAGERKGRKQGREENQHPFSLAVVHFNFSGVIVPMDQFYINQEMHLFSVKKTLKVSLPYIKMYLISISCNIEAFDIHRTTTVISAYKMILN